MAGRVGAAIGKEGEALGLHMVLQQLALLGHGGVAIVVAVGDVAEERYGAIVIDGGAHPGMDDLVIADAMAGGDVCRGIVAGVGGSWLGLWLLTTYHLPPTSEEGVSNGRVLHRHVRHR